jgi:two-component system nitrate/nitrite response regulator NarL
MKLLVVDDHPLVRKGIISILSFEKNIESIKEASCVKKSYEMLQKFQPDIAILDLYLGNEDGLDIVKKAKERGLQTKFIVLTTSSKAEDFKRAKDMNVDGYLLKESFIEDILYAIKVVYRGKIFYDPSILEYEFGHKEKSMIDELTEREMDVLRELGHGLCNSQIAKKLYISENTVKKHVSSILSKLELQHRTEAALYANNAFALKL